MNILHVLSQTEVTGAEVYAATLADRQVALGDNVFLVSDTLTIPVAASYTSLPIDKRSYPNRWRNVRSLSSLISRHRIDVVHAHSRAASWVSFFACRASAAALVSTVHGRQHIHLSSRLFNVYSNHVIAISESIKEQLVDKLGLEPHRVTVVPNGLRSSVWQEGVELFSKEKLFGVHNEIKLILFVGRLTGPKGDVARHLLVHVLPEIRKRHPCTLCIIAGTIIPEGFVGLVQKVEQQLGKGSVELKEFNQDIFPLLRAADVVVGSGRVAIEALALGKPLVAFGESQFIGAVSAGNVEEALKTNFGDTGIYQQVNVGSVIAEIDTLLQQPPEQSELRLLQTFIKGKCDINTVESQIRAVYEQAIAGKSSKNPAS